MSIMRPLLVLLSATALLAGACGGGEGGGEPTDADELQDIRSEIEAGVSEPVRREELVTMLFGIATRNAGEPLGDDAFALLEEVVVDSFRVVDEFSDRAPAPPPELVETDAGRFRNLAGFIVAAPPPYEATVARERLHRQFLQAADLALKELEWAATSRTEWAQELLSQGQTEGGWWALVARLEGGMSASMGSKVAGEYAADQVQLQYYRELAVAVGEPAEFLAAWDQLLAATALAGYEPPKLREDYRDGKFITIYAGEAATGAAENARQLTEAVTSLRVFFPATED